MKEWRNEKHTALDISNGCLLEVRVQLEELCGRPVNRGVLTCTHTAAHLGVSGALGEGLDGGGSSIEVGLRHALCDSAKKTSADKTAQKRSGCKAARMRLRALAGMPIVCGGVEVRGGGGTHDA